LAGTFLLCISSRNCFFVKQTPQLRALNSDLPTLYLNIGILSLYFNIKIRKNGLGLRTRDWEQETGGIGAKGRKEQNRREKFEKLPE